MLLRAVGGMSLFACPACPRAGSWKVHEPGLSPVRWGGFGTDPLMLQSSEGSLGLPGWSQGVHTLCEPQFFHRWAKDFEDAGQRIKVPVPRVTMSEGGAGVARRSVGLLPPMPRGGDSEGTQWERPRYVAPAIGFSMSFLSKWNIALSADGLHM